MTSDEIRAAVERLKSIPCDDMPSVYSVTGALMGIDMYVPYDSLGLRNRLIGLLEQADPDTHMELPVDADGEPIRIGDCMEVGLQAFVTGVTEKGFYWLKGTRYEYSMAGDHRHHREPTVEDVLRKMLDSWGELPSNAKNEATIAEYAAKLREVMKDDE